MTFEVIGIIGHALYVFCGEIVCAGAVIGVIVTFRYPDAFDEQAIRKVAQTARPRFEGMAGLRSKAFALNAGKREATNFYVWDSEEAARAFFTAELLQRVTGLYGVSPSVEFVEVAELPTSDRGIGGYGSTGGAAALLTDRGV